MDGDVLQKNPLTILFCPFLFPQQWLFSLFSSFSNNAYFRFFQELSGNYNWQFGAIFAKPFRNSIFIISSTFSFKKKTQFPKILRPYLFSLKSVIERIRGLLCSTLGWWSFWPVKNVYLDLDHKRRYWCLWPIWSMFNCWKSNMIQSARFHKVDEK